MRNETGALGKSATDGYITLKLRGNIETCTAFTRLPRDHEDSNATVASRCARASRRDYSVSNERQRGLAWVGGVGVRSGLPRGGVSVPAPESQRLCYRLRLIREP